VADGTQIEWTDATWNPVTGCTKVSPGCAHCYITSTPAFRIAGRKFVNGSTDIRFHSDRLEKPLSWRAPKLVFVNSLSDLFHGSVHRTFIARVYATMVAAYWHTFQVLTKRPARRQWLLDDPSFRDEVASEAARLINPLRGKDPMGSGRTKSYVATLNLAHWMDGAAKNIWEGVTTENQRWADDRIPVLLATPAAVRFISAEPLLGPVNLDDGECSWLTCNGSEHIDEACLTRQTGPAYGHYRGIDWVIVGGESGPGARSMDIAWARSIVEQCKAAGVPVFVKQLGAKPLFPCSCGKAAAAAADNAFCEEPARRLKHRKGGDMSEWPEDLRVREWPV
jgi:protein gp37